MIEISYVEEERDEMAKPIRHFDPRRGLSDYTIYTLHTSRAMQPRDKGVAGEYIKKLLRAADYDNEFFEKVACEPIACYVHNMVCIKLILFSCFSADDVKNALVSGRKNLEC